MRMAVYVYVSGICKGDIKMIPAHFEQKLDIGETRCVPSLGFEKRMPDVYADYEEPDFDILEIEHEEDFKAKQIKRLEEQLNDLKGAA